MRAFSFAAAFAAMSLFLGCGGTAQAYSFDDLSGDWTLSYGGQTDPLTLEPDSGWIVGNFDDGGGDAAFAIRARDAAFVGIEIYASSGERDDCEGTVSADGASITGNCQNGGAFELTR